MKYSGVVVLLFVFLFVSVSSLAADSNPHCLRPVGPQFGGWHATTHDFSVGTLVTFYCLHGYNLVGSQRAVCAIDGLRAFWVGKAPKCIQHAAVTRCLDPGSPENGQRVLGGTRVGDTVHFSCRDGFDLQGSAKLVCQNGGKWSAPIPKCTRVIKCPDPGVPLHGYRVMKDTNVGAIATYSCNRGYRLVGEASIICHNIGRWSRAKPLCIKIATPCPDPGTPTNGRRQLELLRNGGTVHYSCDDGYVLVGEAKRTCHNGQWTGNLPVCVGIDCGHPDNIDNSDKTLSDGTRVNSVVSYYCKAGYVLRGSKTRRCALNGYWTGTVPECVAVVDCGKPTAPRNGGVNVDKTIIGSTAVYYCKEGFKLSGKAQRICKLNGKWSGSIPSCNVVDCGDPGTPRNGNRDLSSTMFRSVVQYSCNSGYYLVGDTMRLCLASGKWSGILPTCKLVNCGDPGTPENGGRKVSSTTFRSVVLYSCNDGFSLVGDDVRVCKASGEWSGFIPTCKKILISCGNPGVPINGRSNYRDNKVGSIVTHSCIAGFALRGDRQRRCLPTGVWSGSVPICQRIDCGNPGSVANGRVIFTSSTVGSRARIDCNDGYLLNGNPERICQENGRWSGVLPTCVAIDCGDPGTPTNGRRDLRGTKFGDIVVYFCDSGFILKGSSSRSCQRDGRWSNSLPVCQSAVVDCGQPEPLEFGFVDVTSTTEDSVAVYTCENGYRLVGVSVRTCLSSGEWSGTPPFCTIIDCGLPEAPVGGFVQVTSTTFGSEIIYTCDTGYLLIGNSVRKCDITGAWSGTVPTCQPVSCKDPGTPANGIRRLIGDAVPGSIVTYECIEGYILEGADSRVCQPDGTWSATLPRCRALLCGDPGRLVNGNRIITRRTVGSEVLFTCNHGYTLVGNSVRTCQPDQTWSGSVPLCVLVDCGDPGLPANAARTFTQSTFNSVVTYTCNVNFMLSGESVRRCQADGTWSGTLPSCEPKELVMCGDPGIPENGQRSVTSNLVTAVVTFSCNEGYTLVGDNQRTCLPTGQWSGVIPSCEQIDCGNPGKPTNGIVIGTDFTFGATVEYECTDGFVLVGVKTRTCMENGMWSGETPLCKKSAATQCDDPGVPENGRRIGNNLEIGSVIYFQCFDGYELVGETSIVCLPGAIWSSRGPFCRIISETCNGDGIEVFDSCRRKCTCRGGVPVDCCRFRRDYASLNLADKLQYIDAVVQVSTDPVYKPQYDSLVSLYQQLSNSLVHNSDPLISQFIPWHRYFLIEYENLLRQISCNITIPFWDWTGLPKNPYVSDVFDINSGFGDSSRLNDSCVNVGAFAVNKWVLPPSVGGGCLKRQYQLRNFPTRDAVDRDLLPNIASSFVTVHRSLQLVMHNVVRCTIGGTMCTAGDSAADPLYILHLSKIDSIYSHWQDLKMGRQLVRYADDNSFLTGTDSLTVAELSDNQVLPYGVSVCYDSPFDLKNFQPAKRSASTTPCMEPAEMESLGLSAREKEIIRKMCNEF